MDEIICLERDQGFASSSDRAQVPHAVAFAEFMIVDIDEFPRIPRVQRVRDAGAIAMIHIAADTSTPYAGLVSIRLQQGRRFSA